VTALNGAGSSTAATAKNINTYSIVETFNEPMTQPNDTIFTGRLLMTPFPKRYRSDRLAHQSMTKADPACVGSMMTPCAYGGPMTTVALSHQLSAVSDAALGGMLVTTFALTTTDTFNGGGFAPGGTEIFPA